MSAEAAPARGTAAESGARPEAGLVAALGAVERALEAEVEETVAGCPAAVAAAAREAVLGPGKRIRPLVCVAAYGSAGGRDPGIAALACAVELVHAFSLVHDDLPCMDDDVVRRGRPTLHVRIGPIPAALAGAMLLPAAFEVLCRAGRRMELPEPRIRRMAALLASAAGAAGMVGGQLLDLRAEGRAITPRELEGIHRGKTAELMAASAVLGGLAAGAGEALRARLEEFGRLLGLAFQITDDLLDRVGREERMGKERGRDLALSKATGPAVLGVEDSRRRAETLVARARAALVGVPRPGRLDALAAGLLGREA